MSENILSVDSLSKAFAHRELFQNVSFGLDQGEKVGLIGPNGAGKSTLLKLILGQEAPDTGQIAIRKGIKIGYLQQFPDFGTARNGRELLESVFQELKDTIAAYEKAAAALEDTEALLLRIDELGGWDYSHYIARVADDFELDLDAPLSVQSGGERKRLAIAQLILSKPDLILLDEPTNHLDPQTVEQLEEWLALSPATVILVTHDRYFLDRVVSRMFAIQNRQLRVYEGNYSDYVAAAALEEALSARTRHRRLQHLLGELDWARRSPPARTGKSRARLERLEEVQKEIDQLSIEKLKTSMTFGSAPRLGNTILEARDLSIKFEKAPLFEHLSLALRKKERIGIIGPNGAGKSTLLEIMRGAIPPTEGEVDCGSNTRIALFDQKRSILEPQATIRSTLLPKGGDSVFPPGGSPVHIQSWIDRFGFTANDTDRKIESLSGGERTRVALARFLLESANVLFLDEPTNDLDIETLSVLEEALLAFDGSVMVVSHDRYFLDRIATAILAFEETPKGVRVTLYPGDYSTYKDKRDQQKKEAERQKKAEQPKPAQRPAKPKKALSFAESKELEQMEANIEEAEMQQAQLEEALNDASVWQNPDRARQIQADYAQAKDRVSALYARWDALLAKAASDRANGLS